MSIYDVELHTLEGEPATLATHHGEVLLVVNVASRCGFTPQYEGLQDLHVTYAGRGFSVLGFPCNQFLGQEPGDADEIREFCTSEYGVTFPLYEKVEVNGENRHPLYGILTATADASGAAGDVGWNFEKFLVARDGRVAARFRTNVAPDDPALVEKIEALLDEQESPL